MELVQGSLYFISDDFFEKVEDSNLMVNYATIKRPHYYAVRDVKTGLLWMIPCSSRVEKYQRIIHDRKNRHRSTLGLRIVKIRGEKTVLLFQSMFPIREKYIVGRYFRAGMPVLVANPETVEIIERQANRVITFIRRGIHFFPDQPDAMRIEKLMLEELAQAEE